MQPEPHACGLHKIATASDASCGLKLIGDAGPIWSLIVALIGLQMKSMAAIAPDIPAAPTPTAHAPKTTAPAPPPLRARLT